MTIAQESLTPGIATEEQAKPLPLHVQLIEQPSPDATTSQLNELKVDANILLTAGLILANNLRIAGKPDHAAAVTAVIGNLVRPFGIEQQ